MVLPDMTKHWGGDELTYGVLRSVGSISNLFGALFVGALLVDVYSVRYLLPLMLLLGCALPLLLMAMSRSLEWLLGWRVSRVSSTRNFLSF